MSQSHCPFSEDGEHVHKTVKARDPFTGEVFIEYRCAECGKLLGSTSVDPNKRK